MMTNRCGGFRCQEVPGRGLEELEHIRVFEGWRVGHIDHHICPGQSLRQPLSRNRVDAGVRRRCHRTMTLRSEPGDELGTDEARPSDDHDVHNQSLSVPSYSPNGARIRKSTVDGAL